MNWLGLVEASANARETDTLFAALLVMTAAVIVLVFGLIWIYVIRYRAGNPLDRGALTQKSWYFEMGWTTATLVAFFGLFLWGADLYVRLYRAPPDGLKIYVVGKQWMWKVEHPEGQREINALHVPVDTDIQLLMTSEDVIHDFSVPAFRIKHDVLPGRYETLWFRPEVPGHYHLFCTQFCGTDHAAMGGEVVVMTQPDYQAWLGQNHTGRLLTDAGQAVFARYGCAGCHGADGNGRGPALDGVFGSHVALADGSTAVADETFLRQAVVAPSHAPVAGYPPVMPSFSGIIPEDDMTALIAYLKSLSSTETQG